MEVNLKKISVTHVGSLPRKQEVVDFIFARENNQKYNQDDFDSVMNKACLLYTSPSPRDRTRSRMPSSA